MQLNNVYEIIQYYPNLTFDESTKCYDGYLYVIDNDRYFVNIDISNFPKRFPKVWEVNERIPQKPDRHINSDNSLCFTTPAKEEIFLATKVKTVLDFIKLVLVPFLQNNSYYEYHNTYKFGEYAHNPIIATFDTYSELLQTDSLVVILNAVDMVLKGHKIRPNDLCYCGSNKKIKKCLTHYAAFKNLRLISKETLKIGHDVLNLAWLTKQNCNFCQSLIISNLPFPTYSSDTARQLHTKRG